MYSHPASMIKASDLLRANGKANVPRLPISLDATS